MQMGLIPGTHKHTYTPTFCVPCDIVFVMYIILTCNTNAHYWQPLFAWHRFSDSDILSSIQHSYHQRQTGGQTQTHTSRKAGEGRNQRIGSLNAWNV